MSGGGFFRAMLAVMSAFAGIRGRKNAEDDWRRIRPAHIIAAGLLLLALFVASLLLVVQSIV